MTALHLHAIGWTVNLVLPDVTPLFFCEKASVIEGWSTPVHNLVSQVLLILPLLDVIARSLLHDVVDVVWGHSSTLQILFPRGHLVMQPTSVMRVS